MYKPPIMQKHRPGSPTHDPRSQKKPKYDKEEESRGSIVKVSLSANFWNMRLRFNTIYQYTVEFEPDIQNIRARRYFLGQHTPTIGTHFLWDKILLTQNDIGNEKTLESKGDKGETFAIHILFAKKIELNDPKENSQALKQIFNIQVKSVLMAQNDQLQQLGRKGMLFEKTYHSVRNSSLKLMLGYQVQVVSLQSGLFLNVGDAMKVIRDETALQYMIRNKSDSIIGKVVYAQYGRGQTYRIDGVDRSKTPLSTFKQNASKKLNRPEREITYEQYYKETYGTDRFVRITDTKQNLLISKMRRRDQVYTIHLIPELVIVTGFDDYDRKDIQLKKNITEASKPSIPDKIANLNNFSKKYFDPSHSNEAVKKAIKQWGIEIRPQMFQFQGKKFPVEELYFYGNKTVMPTSDRADWTNFYRNDVNFVDKPNVDKWILFAPSSLRSDANHFLTVLKDTSKGYGLNFAPPKMIEVRESSYAANVQDALARDQDTQFVLFILPSKSAEPYNSLKKIVGNRPSQGITSFLLKDSKKLKSICNKLAVQITAKLGKIPWKFDYRTDVPTMIVGLACGPFYGDESNFVSGIAASFTDDFGKYFSNPLPCPEKQISNMKALIGSAWEYFTNFNKVSPGRIIIYREGLSDGQIDSLSRFELQQILGDLPNGVSLAYIIVTRKTNTKIFNSEGSYSSNPAPGTVVDSDIVRPVETISGGAKRYDFYLISQATTHGTVSPAHYHVTYDTTDLGSEGIQKLSYKLCHIYYNWSGTVALPAPIVYAKKLVHQVGTVIKSGVDPSTNIYYV